MSKSSHTGRDASRVNDKDFFTGNQPDLFQQLESAPLPDLDLDIHFELLAAYTHAIKLARQRGMTRDRIVDEMNRLMPELKQKITLRQLNSWTANSQERKEFPGRYLPAFCAATNCYLPLSVMVRPLGQELADARELAHQQLGRIRIEGAALKRQERQLIQELQR